MSQYSSDCKRHIEDLLSTLVSLRVFTTRGYEYPDHRIHAEKYLSYITDVSGRAPHLEYFAIFEAKYHYAKRVRGKWAICDEVGFPSHKL
jgi:hypothetical protein